MSKRWIAKISYRIGPDHLRMMPFEFNEFAELDLHLAESEEFAPVDTIVITKNDEYIDDSVIEFSGMSDEMVTTINNFPGRISHGH